MTYIPLSLNHNWKMIASARSEQTIRVQFGKDVLDWFSDTNIHDWQLIEPTYTSQVYVVKHDKDCIPNKKIGDLMVEEAKQIVREGRVGIEFKNSKDAIRFKLRWC